MAKKNKTDSAPAVTADGRMEKFGVKTESKKVKKREALIRILVIILVLLLIFLFTMFACSSYVNKAGDFTVNLDDNAIKLGITLSETKDFKNATRFLAGEKCDNMQECTYEWLPKDIDDIDGSHNRSNGQEFLAYTFYVRNAGEKTVGYNTTIDIESVALNVDDAARVMVIHNGERAIYAKPKKGTSNVLENNEGHYLNTANFLSNTRVMEIKDEDFKVGDTDKFTVVIWLEGWDPECVDDILEGEIKMAMNFRAYELDDSDGSAA